MRISIAWLIWLKRLVVNLTALAGHLISTGVGFGLTGPLWVSFCQEFDVVFSTWLAGSQFVNLLGGGAASGGGTLPPGVLVPGVSLSCPLVPGSVNAGPLGVLTDTAIGIGLSTFPGAFLTSGLGGGGGGGGAVPGCLPVLGSHFLGPDLGVLLSSSSLSLTGPLGRAWLLDLGLRVQLGLRVSFPGGVPVLSPSGVPVLNAFGVLCPA